MFGAGSEGWAEGGEWGGERVWAKGAVDGPGEAVCGALGGTVGCDEWTLSHNSGLNGGERKV